jgi:hypothetical protein
LSPPATIDALVLLSAAMHTAQAVKGLAIQNQLLDAQFLRRPKATTAHRSAAAAALLCSPECKFNVLCTHDLYSCCC